MQVATQQLERQTHLQSQVGQRDYDRTIGQADSNIIGDNSSNCTSKQPADFSLTRLLASCGDCI